jgi:hypothetical protein
MKENRCSIVHISSDGSLKDYLPESLKQEPRAPTLRNLFNLAMGKARFYIQRFGGRSNPYGAGTSTALIAVRG